MQSPVSICNCYDDSINTSNSSHIVMNTAELKSTQSTLLYFFTESMASWNILCILKSSFLNLPCRILFNQVILYNCYRCILQQNSWCLRIMPRERVYKLIIYASLPFIIIFYLFIVLLLFSSFLLNLLTVRLFNLQHFSVRLMTGNVWNPSLELSFLALCHTDNDVRKDMLWTLLL